MLKLHKRGSPMRAALLLAAIADCLLASRAFAHEDNYMFVWADQASAQSYPPSELFSWNALGSVNHIERLEVGRYRINWGSLPSDDFGNTIGRQVSAYGSSSDYCVLDFENFQQVACYDASGSPKDSRFVAFVLGGSISKHQTESASVRALDPLNPSYIATGWNAGTNDPITVTRVGVGRYSVTFTNFASVGVGGGNVHVTADRQLGPGAGNRCTVENWGSETANVRCFDIAGNLADTEFFLFFQRAEADLEGVAFAWADDPSSASYTPSATFSHNPTGGSISATRSATGVYALTWAGMGSVGLGGGNVQVTAYGIDDHRCKVDSWFADTATVRCFDTAGDPVDTRYTAIYRKPIHEPLTRNFAAANVLNPEIAQYTVPSQFSWTTYADQSGMGDAIVTRLATGRHSVQFTGINLFGFDGGNAQVAARGSSPARCKIEGWFIDTVTVLCFDSGGNPTDLDFDVVLFKPDSGDQIGYTWADDASSALYTPPSFYTHNPSGGGVQIIRIATGHYRATFTGIGPVGVDEGLPVVSAYGAGSEQCQLLSWNGDIVDVLCFAPNGIPADSRFSLIWFKPDENMDGFAYAYADLEAVASYSPVPGKAHNPADKPITATRASTGEYQIEWEDFNEHGVAGRFWLSSTVGSTSALCSGGAAGADVGVRCHNVNGFRTDSEYVAVSFTPIALPEPVAMWSLAAGVAFLATIGRRRARR